MSIFPRRFPMTTSKLVLGLDLGVTSIGWALIKTIYDEAGVIILREIIASGVRIFPATTEGTKNTPKNYGRRISRGQRRLLMRKSKRRNELRDTLVSNGLLPRLESSTSAATFESIGEPYELRVRGLDEKLGPFEIGRTIYHLSKRRGFRSNRKSGEEKDTGKVLGGIKKVQDEMAADGFRTLGSYLQLKEKKRKHYTHRTMVEDEFEQIWAVQSGFYPVLLNDQLKASIKNTVFYQRPLRSQRGLIGKCTFETDKKRCDLARQEAQRFRYWQDLNNLQLQDPHSLNPRPLTPDEKQMLAKELEKTKELKYPRLRKLLRISDQVRINLEANEKKLKGNTTACAFRKALPKLWDEFDDEKQNRLTEELFRIDTEAALEKRLRGHWKFDDGQIEKLFGVWHQLEDGYSRLSLKAIRKILPLLMEGKRYDEAASETYGDHRKNFGSDTSEKLPLPPKDLRNPVVTKALHEMRKVVNGILREYGKPDEIRLEMARDLKLTKLQKDRVMKQHNQNKRDNEHAEEFFKAKFGRENISGNDKLKYRLWKEAGERCPYTGETIPPEMLLGDQCVDIEHIIPYSRCFDDSYMNKTICLSGFNRDIKKNSTPYEIFGSDEQKFFEVLERIKDFPRPKLKKFETQQVDFDDMVGRQLSDTRYICREARGYLRQLYPYSADENKYVQVIAGGATANLRRVWHINAILSDGDIEVKNRWDHRHHAIDAIVIALTSRSLYQYISKLSGQNRERMKRHLSGFELPWEGFLNDVEASMKSLTVSHAPTRRIRGQLLEETAYGATAEPGLYVTKKNVSALTAPMIESIVDEHIKQIVKNRLVESDGDLKNAFGNEAPPLMHKNGVTPINKVRIYVRMTPETLVGIKNESGKDYKYYPLAGNHHVEIYENTLTEERKGFLVPRFHAAQRNGIGPVRHGLAENWRFLFSLCSNDYIEFLGDDGHLRFYRVQKMSGGGKVVMIARPFEDARTEYVAGVTQAIQGRNFKNITRKLQVDPLGRLTQAND